MTAIHPMTREYAEYLHDESRSVGSADSISFPADEDEIRSVLRALRTRPLSRSRARGRAWRRARSRAAATS